MYSRAVLGLSNVSQVHMKICTLHHQFHDRVNDREQDDEQEGDPEWYNDDLGNYEPALFVKRLLSRCWCNNGRRKLIVPTANCVPRGNGLNYRCV